MPVSDDDARKPRWIRYEEGATLSRDDKEKYVDFSTNPIYKRSYRNDAFKRMGYNANNPFTTQEVINIRQDPIVPRNN